MATDSDTSEGHSLRDYPCRFEDCEEAYPHPLLLDAHYFEEHEDAVFGERWSDVDEQ